MDNNPKVSIIIPVYNGSDYLGEAIDSALAQTYANVEVIVVNDGSNDGGKTEAIARSYGDRIRYFYKENGGVASALNVGISMAKGEYVSWLSHDDVYMPDKLAVQVEYLRHRTDPAIFYSDFEIIDHESRSLGTRRLEHVEPEGFLYTLFTCYYINGCTMLIPRQCFQVVGLFNEDLKTIQDYDMWFRLAKRYRFEHISKDLVKFRRHSEQGSRTMSDMNIAELNALFVWALDEFSPDDVFHIDQEIVSSESMRFLNLTSICYLNLAVFLWRRGLRTASRHARRLALQKLGEADFLTRMHGHLSLLFCRIWFARLSVWRWKHHQGTFESRGSSLKTKG